MNDNPKHLEKMILIAALFLPALFLFPAQQAFAQSEIAAVWVVEDEAHTVGDPIPLTLVVSHPANHQVILPNLESNWGEFTVAGVSPLTSAVQEDGSEMTLQTYDMRLFAPGDFATPPINIQVTNGNGGLIDVPVAPVEVSIGSVLVEGDQTLRDIKPQAELSIASTWLWLTSGGLLLLAVVGIGLWLRKRRKGVPVWVDPRSPYEIALDDLDQIEEAALQEQGAFREHYALVSDSLRRYLEGNFKIDALDRTTGEIGRELIKVEISAMNSQRMIAVLHECDLVKFSKFTPDIFAASLIVTMTRQLVDLTRPRPSIEPTSPPKHHQGPNEQPRHQWEGVS